MIYKPHIIVLTPLTPSTAGSEDPPTSSLFSPLLKTDVLAKSSEDDPVSQAIARMIEPDDEVRIVATRTGGHAIHVYTHEKSLKRC